MSDTSSSSSLPLVTVLAGFLGAGKTTLLNHLLGQTQGERWALVVNDVGAINIDAKLVAQRAAEVAGAAPAGGGQQVVELGNGCVCCSIKDELAETLAELALTGRTGGPPGVPYDRILIETTGVAEPRGLANLFLSRNPFGKSLADMARLDALVTVVDAAHFLRLWRKQLPASGAVARANVTDGRKDLFELLLEQVEVADLIVINKADLVSADELLELEQAIAGLNARAERHVVEHGQLAREVVLDRSRFDPEETLGSARWLKSLNALAPGATSAVTGLARSGAAKVRAPDFAERYGLRSFVFQARRPFGRARLETLLAGGLPGVVRAKGFVWLREQPDEMAFLTIAGETTRLDILNYWWATLVEQGRASLDDRPPMIRALWTEPAGDRRQELVFIGVDLDEVRLRAELEACLA